MYQNNNQSNWGNNPPPVRPVRPIRPANSGLVGGALCCGILSLFGILTIYLGFIMGGTAIVLALLSRGKNKGFSRQAITAMVLGILSTIITLGMLIFTMTFIFANYGSVNNFLNEYAPIVEENTGLDINGDGIIGFDSSKASSDSADSSNGITFGDDYTKALFTNEEVVDL